ncbi:MAG: adenylylsulfate kinase [Defluviitaleaceae bacterium]|nr:adenylylsulfate kinase [Defluviitaleaceae bacterium]
MGISESIFTALEPILTDALEENRYRRAVVSLSGESGSNNAEITAGLMLELRKAGIDSFILSEMDYFHRIPMYNDVERRNVFRTEGMRELLVRGIYTEALRDDLAKLKRTMTDADASLVKTHPWLVAYHKGGDGGLRSYLGTQREVDFQELSDIIMRFKNGADEVYLKRIGHDESSTWYEAKSCRAVKVLIIEGIYGNSDNLRGVDIPLMLWGSSAAKPKNSFAERICALEHELLLSQAINAKLVFGNPSH